MAHAPSLPNMSRAIEHDSSSNDSDEQPYTIAQNLLSPSPFQRQIWALLLATDQVFHLIRCLRSSVDAQEILEDLHLAHIYLIPPVNIWELVIKLRSHVSWSDVRPLVQSQINRLKHHSYNTGSTRASGLSNSSLAHSSTTSFHSQTNHMSGSSVNVEPSQHRVSEDLHLPQPTRSGTIRPPTVTRPMLKNGQASKKAPPDHKFTCPVAGHSQCRKWICSRERDFYRHVGFEHPGEQAFNAWDYLKYHPQDAPTPAKSDTTDFSATLQQESPNSMYAEVNASDDFPATGEDFHLPMQTLVPPNDYYGHTGIHTVQVSSNSYFNFSDEMEEK